MGYFLLLGEIRGLPWDNFYLGVPEKCISVHFELPGKKDHLCSSTFVCPT